MQDRSVRSLAVAATPSLRAVGGEMSPSTGSAGAPIGAQERSRALAELCHDLRHPAAVIDALVAAVQIECELPPKALARLNQIAAESRRIAELCSEVLSGELGTRPPLLRLDCVAAEVVGATQASYAGVTAVTAPVIVAIDDSSARRVVWNLVDNAVRAAGPNGRVLVAVWSTDTHVRLDVADSGPGFGRGTAGAAGLGLTIVQATARRFGGEVEVGKSELGGALVSVLLPRPTVDLNAAFEPDDEIAGRDFGKADIG